MCEVLGGANPSPGDMRRGFDEDDLLPLSAVQHVVFCPRQFALIHLERIWAESRLTIEGSRLHARTHNAGPRREVREDTVITRRLPLRSLRLGLSGVADVVEFRRVSDEAHATRGGPRGVTLDGLDGTWDPFPVEYKRGRPKEGLADAVQLCAQGMCLEEMLATPVPRGALFYARTRRRLGVAFGEGLRHAVREAAGRIHMLASAGRTPPERYGRKCRRCSLVEICQPKVTGKPAPAGRYLSTAIDPQSEDGAAS